MGAPASPFSPRPRSSLFHCQSLLCRPPPPYSDAGPAAKTRVPRLQRVSHRSIRGHVVYGPCLQIRCSEEVKNALIVCKRLRFSGPLPSSSGDCVTHAHLASIAAVGIGNYVAYALPGMSGLALFNLGSLAKTMGPAKKVCGWLGRERVKPLNSFSPSPVSHSLGESRAAALQ